MRLTTWAKLIEEARQEAMDESPIIHVTLSAKDLAMLFDNGHGGVEGKPFTAWSERRVYFPVMYDGAEWVGSAPRDPCDEATRHVGGS